MARSLWNYASYLKNWLKKSNGSQPSLRWSRRVFMPRCGLGDRSSDAQTVRNAWTFVVASKLRQRVTGYACRRIHECPRWTMFPLRVDDLGTCDSHRNVSSLPFDIYSHPHRYPYTIVWSFLSKQWLLYASIRERPTAQVENNLFYRPVADDSRTTLARGLQYCYVERRGGERLRVCRII